MVVYYCDKCGEKTGSGIIGKFKDGDFGISITVTTIVDNRITLACLCPQCLAAIILKKDNEDGNSSKKHR